MIKHKKLLSLLILAVIIGTLPFLLGLLSKPQENRSRAAATTSLSIQPTSSLANPIQKTIGDTVTLDLMVTPQNDSISFIKFEILYDTTKLSVSGVNSLFIDTQLFPLILEGPVFNPGRIAAAIGIGSDPDKGITTSTRFATITFTTLQQTTTPTEVRYGSNPIILSIGSNQEASSNVISTTSPAYIKISPFVPTPTPTLTPTLTPTPTKTPTPTPTPLPPTLTFTATPTTIPYNGTATLSWSTTGATICNASNDWTGIKPTADTQSTGQLTVSKIYTLQCTGPGGSITKTVTITVQPAPTSTPVPQNTLLKFTTFLHSIGNSGDNVNPNGFSLSNKNPVHPQRNVLVSIYDETNTLVNTKSGIMIYNQANGNFTGTMDIGSTFQTGSYTVAIRTDLFLQNKFPGIQTITAGQQNQLPATTLVAGDTDQNNMLNILDYNRLLDCYTSDIQTTPRDCAESKRLMTDLNDQGTVDRYDYNLFLRELSVQSGFSI